ncbi:SCO1664 family protein [Salsipaludibacter albus]|uniref:SCO1664 family protein n=1 Tax=Salsipaludibacter albus TaxID=2849650 RepID=UPI001EE3E137|nr:SCO1664 family protein [Salsipaludibacter albus]MBY5164392.1 SCO1664 family protein [Salsipaludibacter albus]
MTAALATPSRLATARLEVLGQFADASNTTLLVRLADPGLDGGDDGDAARAGGVAPATRAALRRPVVSGGNAGVEPDRDRDTRPAGGRQPSETVPDPLDLHPAGELGVYKPVRGQRPLWDFDATTLPGREVATAVVDDRLGFGLVPPTVWRDEAPLGPGSVQAYVAHDHEAHWFSWVEDEGARDLAAMARLVVLDLVVNNTDRKGGHVLVADDRIWAIDHGVTFHVEDKVRTVAWELQGERVPAPLRLACAALADWLVTEPDELARHLTPDEIAATHRRAIATAARETFPVLVDRYQLPWPLV